jgi:hypothetical protein
MVDFKKVLRNPAGRHVKVKGERLGAFWTPRVPVIVHSDYIINVQCVLILFLPVPPGGRSLPDGFIFTRGFSPEALEVLSSNR